MTKGGRSAGEALTPPRHRPRPSPSCRTALAGRVFRPALRRHTALRRQREPLGLTASSAEHEVEELLAKTAPLAAAGELGPFKTTSVHDDTAHKPAWPGAEP